MLVNISKHKLQPITGQNTIYDLNILRNYNCFTIFCDK